MPNCNYIIPTWDTAFCSEDDPSECKFNEGHKGDHLCLPTSGIHKGKWILWAPDPNCECEDDDCQCFLWVEISEGSARALLDDQK